MKTKTIPLRNYNKYKRLRQLVEQWTRAAAMSRSPAIDFPECAEYDQTRRNKEDEIRLHMYGVTDLYAIGKKLGLPMDSKKKQKDK